MKKLALILVILPVFVFAHPGGVDENGGHINRSTGEYHCHQADCILPTVASDASIKVTSFNIQFLGNFKKRDNAALAALVSDQDIVIIQELVAPPYTGTFPDNSSYKPDAEAAQFFDEMETRGFDYILSEEDTGTGSKNHLNSTATEWWVAFFKPESVEYADDLPHGFLASDRTDNPKYERVPFAFPFRTMEGNDFVLISVHLMPGRSDGPRRKEELNTIYDWIATNDSDEHDFIIAGDMNIEDCEELADVLRTGFQSLNNTCQDTNTNQRSPKPYDHVIYNSIEEIQAGFEVVNLIDAMRTPWALGSTAQYPGDPYDHDKFRVVYSDHHPVKFKINTVGDDD